MVQSIKRPVLLEIWGPLFISTGTTSNVIYHLVKATAEATRREVPMRLIDPILAELEQEAAATGRVLARVPDAHLS